jgi:hypothetical protein
MNRRPKVHVTIDTLALGGFDAQQRSVLVAALQAELGRQLAEPETFAALQSGRSLAGIKVEPFTLKPGGTAEQIGVQSSQQLVRSLTGQRVPRAR